jgi:hypothetical protein
MRIWGKYCDLQMERYVVCKDLSSFGWGETWERAKNRGNHYRSPEQRDISVEERFLQRNGNETAGYDVRVSITWWNSSGFLLRLKWGQWTGLDLHTLSHPSPQKCTHAHRYFKGPMIVSTAYPYSPGSGNVKSSTPWIGSRVFPVCAMLRQQEQE